MSALRTGALGAMLLLGASAAAQTLPSVIHPTATWRRGEAASHREGSRFAFDTTVNGQALPMLFDTGATRVVLRAEDAARAGIDVASLSYSMRAETANGKADFAPVVIRTLTIGDITRRDVAAAVAKPGTLAMNLLGQSFLAKLGGYRLEGERLVLLDGR